MRRSSPALVRVWVPRATSAAFVIPLLLFTTRWLIDVGSYSKIASHVPLRQLWLGLGSSLVIVLVTGLAFATAAALLTYLGGSRGERRVSLRARASSWLAAEEPRLRHERTVLLCTLTWLLVLYLGATRVATEQLFLHMARPSYAALAAMTSQLLLGLALSALYAPLFALTSLLVRAAQRVPRLGSWLFGSPRRCLLGLSLIGLAGVSEMLVRHRGALAYLPWRDLLGWFTSAIGASFLWWLWPSLPRRARAALALLACALVLASASATFAIRPSDRVAHDIAERRLSASRVALELLHQIGDFDGDGRLSFWGGDCAAWDPDVYPGALDIPGNGRDEDCDGRDNPRTAFALEAAVMYEVPSELARDLPIVLITIDAFAASHLRSFGAARDVMPELEKYARSSALFRSCYAEGPSTRLSFPSLFTSRWDSQIESKLIGRHPYPLGASEQTLAELLGDAGYETSAVLSERYFAPENWRGLTSGFSQLDRSSIATRPHNAAQVTDASLSALKRQGEKPKFLWVHYFDAHPEHELPQGIASYGDAVSDRYDAELHLIDRELGRLLKGVEALYHGGALVIITGDHGIDFASPRHQQASYGYDLSSAVLHVPLIVHGPFVAPRSFEHVVSTMDIMPTLANLVRAKPLHALYGRSLVPELLDGRVQREAVLFHQFHVLERRWTNEDPLELVSLRTGRFNLVHDRVHNQFELYDFRADPLESQDLTLVPEHGQTFVALRALLNRYTYSVHNHNLPQVAATR